ncbi:TonB-dependent siderophore receptor [Pelomonas sp. KK5]|uniref:TonB-dependent siderophore receptor n=1 Tax=Pelomonas sp. KK5 TaxID=1855730 RepID=UPI00097C0943|nr:TonB-dependent siderophore receptor [Pelomonas sp. KK5]
MKHPEPKLTSIAIAMAIMAAPALAQTAGDATTKAADKEDGAAAASSLSTVVITGQRINRVSNGATNLDLEAKDTPQSISFITQEQMRNFGASDINAALRLATGIRVEQVGTNQTQYLSRGFEIKNTQIDGVGMPNGWGLVTNAMDTFGYERVEVVRGANGLLTGVGNASGTINYVRKRPTNKAGGSVGLSYGSWDTKRVEADYSTPLTADGNWAGRVMVAAEDGGSYLRDFKSDRNFFYGVVDGQIGDHGTLAAGFSRQKADTSGNMWGTLTFVDSDGKQLEWDRSASTTQKWTYWNTITETGFVDYTHEFGDWKVKASYNYRTSDNDSTLFMAYSSTGINPATGLGLAGWAYKSKSPITARLVDLSINGRYELLGRKHEATFGVSYSTSERVDNYNPTSFAGPAFGALPAFPYSNDAIPEPTFGASTFYTSLNQRIKRAYAVTRLALTDSTHAIIGANFTEYHRDGLNADTTAFDQTEKNTSPYVGLSYDFTPSLLGYFNYSYIYQPQEQFTADHNYISPSKGTNYEVGIKGEWLDKRLLTTAAYFDASQQGLATYVGTVFLEGSAFGAYKGVDVKSKGFELEATGKINRFTDLVVGYTHISMSGATDGATYPWVPRNMVNVALSARVPQMEKLSLGVSGRWQSGTSNVDSYSRFNVSQGSYAVLNAFAAWEFMPGLTLRANVNNIADQKYINSLYIASYYAAPRNYTASLNWRF